MRIVKDFRFDRERNDYVFQYKTEDLPINFAAQATVSRNAYEFGGVPLQHVWADLRRRLMREVEDALFKGEPR